MKSKRQNYKKLLLKLNFIIFPYFWITIMVLTIVESITYSGFISKNFVIDIRLLILALVFSGILSRISLPLRNRVRNGVERQYEYYRSLAILNKILFPAFFVIVLILEYFEFKNYQGYVYTSFIHIDPQLLLTVLGLSLFLILLRFDSLISRDLTTRKYKTYNLNLSDVISEIFVSVRGLIISGGLLALLIWIIIINIFSTMSNYSPAFIKMLKHPLASQEWKMKEAFGELYYDYMQFINNNTPESAIILIPKMQGDWLQISNQGYTRYFVYPRELISEDQKGIIRNPTHILVLGNKNEGGALVKSRWPDIEIDAKKTVYMPKDPQSNVITVEGNFNPDNPLNDNWGIIELKEN